MREMLLRNGRIFAGDGFFEGDVRFRDGRIVEIGTNLDPEEKTINLTGRKVLPGLIDIHTHGCGMRDFCEGTPEAFDTLAKTYIQNGVTTVCPTSMTLPIDELERIYRAYDAWMQTDHPGSRLVGINMEGPFISVEKRGAHQAEFVVPAEMDAFLRLYRASGERIRLVDVAPEVPGNLDFIRAAKEYCTVSVAHSAADYAQTMAAFEAGAASATHLFNAMTGLSHRAPGVVGAVFDGNAYAELICDGEHVSPPVLRLAAKLLGDRMVIVSDSLMAAGMPDGTRCTLGGEEVLVQGGKAVLPNGTIAGSVVNIAEEIRRLIAFGVDEAQAIRAGTINPARVIGMDREIGSIEVGKRADLVVLDQEDRPWMPFRDGKMY